LHRKRREEEEEEERKIEEYREVGMRLKEYPEEDVRKARKLISSFIRAAEEVEEVVSCCCNILFVTQIKYFTMIKFLFSNYNKYTPD